MLKEKAAENGRSLNAEIIHRLTLTLATANLKAAEDLTTMQELNYYNGAKIMDLLNEATDRLQNLMVNAHRMEDMVEHYEQKHGETPSED